LCIAVHAVRIHILGERGKLRGRIERGRMGKENSERENEEEERRGRAAGKDSGYVGDCCPAAGDRLTGEDVVAAGLCTHGVVDAI
jgi:hypothetical protein